MSRTEERITSRRALLARAPAAAALALAVPVSTFAGGVGGDDAELLALGERFDWLAAEEERIFQLEAPYWAAHHRLIVEMHAEGRCHRNEEWAERFQTIEKFRPPGPSSADITGEMDAPTRRIMALPAYTVAGLAVKARATAYACGHMDNSDFASADWDHMHVRMLVAAVLTMAGQPLIDGEM
jgi:hypothetical protein